MDNHLHSSERHHNTGRGYVTTNAQSANSDHGDYAPQHFHSDSSQHQNQSLGTTRTLRRRTIQTILRLYHTQIDASVA